MDNTTNTSQPDTRLQESAAPIADRWLIRVRGAVFVEIENQYGNRIGPYIPHKIEEEEGEDSPEQNQDLPNLWEVTIPGATYSPGRDFTSVFLGQPGIYTCRCTGRAPSAVDIYFTPFSSQAKIRTIFFQSIPISGQGRAQFTYDTSHPTTSPILILVDGEERQEILPTAVLDPEESEDSTPPTTTVSIQDGQIVMSATDHPGGSGVWRTYYTTDARTFSVYNKPLPLPPEAKIIMGFSIDRNGNREYPGMVLPVLQLSQTSIVFRVRAGSDNITTQRVRVMNADPIPLTGQLQWEASTDTEWLAIEPKEGMTPDLITLSVQVENLKLGLYKGTVIVRSPTLGVVYAERVISVVLEVISGQS